VPYVRSPLKQCRRTVDSNRTVTRENVREQQQRHLARNRFIYAVFGTPGNAREGVAPPSHGGGQGFKSPRVHFFFVAICR
jgi:hypothetical protein